MLNTFDVTPMDFFRKFLGQNFLFFVLVSVNSVIGVNGVEICACDDLACIHSAAEAGFQAAVKQDPICIGEVSGEDSGLIFNFTNMCMEKFSQCQISDVCSDWESQISFKLFCEDIISYGHYQFNGTLFGWTPIHGDGPFYIDCTGFQMDIQAKLNKVPGPNGQEVYEMERDRVNMDAEGYVFVFDNLYEGDPNAKLKSFYVHFLANTMWRYVGDKMRRYFVAPYTDNWFENANMYLRDIPAGRLCTRI